VKVMDRCKIERPELQALASSQVACWLYPEGENNER
jgi:hypothetical protein